MRQRETLQMVLARSVSALVYIIPFPKLRSNRAAFGVGPLPRGAQDDDSTR